MATEPLNRIIWALVTLCKNLDLDGMGYRALLTEKVPLTVEDGRRLEQLRSESEPIVAVRYAELLDGLESGKDAHALLQTFLEQSGYKPKSSSVNPAALFSIVVEPERNER